MAEDVEHPAPEIRDPAPWYRRRWVAMAVCALGLVFAGLLVGAGVLLRSLPSIHGLKTYRPVEQSIVLGRTGTRVARFGPERRQWVPYERIPKVLVDAVIAAEDDDYFSHEGLDYPGILRCLVKNWIMGRHFCGASTITQQTVKTFLLSSEKSYGRKVREAVLAKRLEDALSKTEILHLYLNQINFGPAYGVQEAALAYFGKDVGALTLAEAALLAGLPNAPSRLNPYRHLAAAQRRQHYVLGRMLETGRISEQAAAQAKAEPIQLAGPKAEPDLLPSSHSSAHIRAQLTATLGDEQVERGGLQVESTIDPTLQRAAESALDEGLRALDKRQGFRGPLWRLVGSAKTQWQPSFEAWGKALPEGHAISLPAKLPARVSTVSRHVQRVEAGAIFRGWVERVEDGDGYAEVRAPPIAARLYFKTTRWARRFDVLRRTPRPKRMSEVLRPGDVVSFKIAPSSPGEPLRAQLEQSPEATGAIVALRPADGEVLALVGGHGPHRGGFNRAIAARRQAGSTFKPLLYAAALATERYTTTSRCLDVPRVYRDESTGRTWKPRNYDGRYDGELPFRRALALSKNQCSVELLEALGPRPVIELSRRAGISGPLPPNLTLALGTAEVSPMEMASVYAAFAAGGWRHPPRLIRSVTAPSGRSLWPAAPPPERVLSRDTAYLITSMLTSVIESGTAQSLRSLDVHIAGKTGTTSQSKDAWFVGYTKDIVVATWVGFDDGRPLGPGESGGRAAIPIWRKVMQHALEHSTGGDFQPPESIVFAWVDPDSGALSLSPEHGQLEPFTHGTAPTDIANAADVLPDEFLKEDYSGALAP